ncbi:MAG: type II toxin-antitoxin system RelE/ParE family toxin [Oscillospiraceae bacterium]|jgi:addiction module RelE/StbE family toxin|nr:type II toxin-antitoxin system RelE/ParE family toxin [Oscillospiraceae bacterium]
MKIRVAPTALNDLKDIEDYITNGYDNPSAAKRTIKKIISSYLKLQTSPYIGVSLRLKYSIDTPVRFIVSGNYLVFYETNNNYVEIKRVIHGKRDYCKLLFGIKTTDDLSEDEQE